MLSLILQWTHTPLWHSRNGFSALPQRSLKQNLRCCQPNVSVSKCANQFFVNHVVLINSENLIVLILEQVENAVEAFPSGSESCQAEVICGAPRQADPVL